MKIDKYKAWDYFILVARFLLGWTFLRYGYGKLTDGQFGVSDEEMNTILKELSPFRISWYLFEMQPFKAFIGISQIICGFLLVINRTAIIGAFIFLPIVITILIIDMTFMPPSLAESFTRRLLYYILLDFLILWHYKEKMIKIWDAVWKNVNTKFKYPIGMYLFLPVLAFILEFIPAIPSLIYYLFTEPEMLIDAFQSFWEMIFR